MSVDCYLHAGEHETVTHEVCRVAHSFAGLEAATKSPWHPPLSRYPPVSGLTSRGRASPSRCWRSWRGRAWTRWWRWTRSRAATWSAAAPSPRSPPCPGTRRTRPAPTWRSTFDTDWVERWRHGERGCREIKHLENGLSCFVASPPPPYIRSDGENGYGHEDLLSLRGRNILPGRILHFIFNAAKNLNLNVRLVQTFSLTIQWQCSAIQIHLYWQHQN